MNIKIIARIVGVIALGLTIVPPVLTATESLAESTMKGLMLAGCVLWFITAPTIMKGSTE